MRGTAAATAVCALALALTARSAVSQAVTFDFDTGAPPLRTGQSLPLDQASGGVTAHFTGTFSAQSDASTHFNLSRFSGNYLYPNTTEGILQIAFDKQLDSITFTFATTDFQQNETPTTIQLTAYEDSTGTPAVGSATAHGAYAGDTMPMGTLSFGSGSRTFNLVEIKIPPAPLAALGFLVDNIAVTVNAARLRVPRTIPWRLAP